MFLFQAGTVIGNPLIATTDPDSGDTTTFTLYCGSLTGYFMMNKSTGQVSYQSDYDLDTGSLPTSVNCTVKVTDIGGLTATASLVINIGTYGIQHYHSSNAVVICFVPRYLL